MDASYVVYFIRAYLDGEPIVKVGYTGDPVGRWGSLRDQLIRSKTLRLHALDCDPVLMFTDLTKTQAIILEARLHEEMTSAGWHVENEWFIVTDHCLDLIAAVGEQYTGYPVERPTIAKTYLLPGKKNTRYTVGVKRVF